MSQFRVLAAVAITGLVATTSVAAQGKSGSHGGGATTTHGKSGAGATTTTSTTTTTHGNGNGNGNATTRGKSGETTRGKSDSDHGRPSSPTTSSTTTGSTSTGPTALSTKISQNPQQLARITAMLPTGVTLDQATAGFRNQGQFIAALNASKNQGVSFTDLQKAMTVDGLSLGQAVRKLQTAPAPASTSGSGTGATTGTTSGTTTNPS